jgi:hypothetical protein
MSPPRRQSNPEQPSDDDLVFPNLEGMETTLDQISRAQENTTTALEMVYDKINSKMDRMESELRKEHTVLLDKTSLLVTNQAVLMATIGIRPQMPIQQPMQQPVQSSPTNINITGISGGNATAKSGAGSDDGEKSEGGFFSGKLGMAIKIGIVALMFSIAAAIIASVGASFVKVKSGDTEATVIFKDKSGKATDATKDANSNDK